MQVIPTIQVGALQLSASMNEINWVPLVTSNVIHKNLLFGVVISVKISIDQDVKMTYSPE